MMSTEFLLLTTVRMYSTLVICLLGVHVISSPVPQSNSSNQLQESSYFHRLATNRSTGNRRPRLPEFKYFYLAQNASISIYIHPSQQSSRIEIVGSPGTSWRAVSIAASYIKNITKHMSPNLFNNIASKTSVGIFSANEKLTVFPEFSYYSNGYCGSSCAGYCEHTCTADGRKREDLTGMGGKRAVILDDNVLCSDKDPFKGKENILAHEFSHTVHRNALTIQQKIDIQNAFERARRSRIWNINSYAMLDKYEYFAEGATVFFGVNRYNRWNTGGMNLCGADFCKTEEDARRNLMEHDLDLYKILIDIFTWNRPYLRNTVSICPLER